MLHTGAHAGVCKAGTVGFEPVENEGEAEPAVPQRSRHTLVFVMAAVLVVAIGAVTVVSLRSDDDAADSGTSAPGLQVGEHWHAALGVYDCGRWIPKWNTPFRPTGPIRTGTNTYAGLHSHGDGLIHMEPVSKDDTGKSATLGRFFTYAGFELKKTSIAFVDVKRKNGDLCNGKPGVLRWAVNGKEHHRDPSSYQLRDGVVIALVFTTADASLPPQSAVPSYPQLRRILGDEPIGSAV
jgi:hypothetical protein